MNLVAIVSFILEQISTHVKKCNLINLLLTILLTFLFCDDILSKVNDVW